MFIIIIFYKITIFRINQGKLLIEIHFFIINISKELKKNKLLRFLLSFRNSFNFRFCLLASNHFVGRNFPSFVDEDFKKTQDNQSLHLEQQHQRQLQQQQAIFVLKIKASFINKKSTEY